MRRLDRFGLIYKYTGLHPVWMTRSYELVLATRMFLKIKYSIMDIPRMTNAQTERPDFCLLQDRSMQRLIDKSNPAALCKRRQYFPGHNRHWISV
jgi:hypothetical protein